MRLTLKLFCTRMISLLQKFTKSLQNETTNIRIFGNAYFCGLWRLRIASYVCNW